MAKCFDKGRKYRFNFFYGSKSVMYNETHMIFVYEMKGLSQNQTRNVENKEKKKNFLTYCEILNCT